MINILYLDELNQRSMKLDVWNLTAHYFIIFKNLDRLYLNFRFRSKVSKQRKWWLCMTVKFVQNLAWQITVQFMKERNFHPSAKIVVLLVASGFSGLKTMIFFTKLFQKLPFTYWTKTSFASFPIPIFLGQQITFLLYYSLFSWREFLSL